MFVLLACAMQCDPTKDKPYTHVPFGGLYCNLFNKCGHYVSQEYHHQVRNIHQYDITVFSSFNGLV